MSTNKTSSGGGLGIGAVIFLIFLVLKLAEIGAVANWSWWWVTSPLWIPLALMLVGFSVCGVILVLKEVLKKS